MKSTAAAMLADAIEAAAATAPKVDAAPDTLPLVRRILKARDPSALAELDAGLAEAARGEPELVAWLTRPLPATTEADLDPLDACIAALSAATAHADKLPPLHPRAATVLTAVANLANRVEKISSGRPQPPTPDEVAERISAARDEAVRKILEHTGDARAKLDADRKALAEWAAQNLGPMIAAELDRRVGAMLGEAQS